jgi:hypothetical protein
MRGRLGPVASALVQEPDHDDHGQNQEERRVKQAEPARPRVGPGAALARRPKPRDSKPPRGSGQEAGRAQRQPSSFSRSARCPAADARAGRCAVRGARLALGRARPLAKTDPRRFPQRGADDEPIGRPSVGLRRCGFNGRRGRRGRALGRSPSPSRSVGGRAGIWRLSQRGGSRNLRRRARSRCSNPRLRPTRETLLAFCGARSRGFGEGQGRGGPRGLRHVLHRSGRTATVPWGRSSCRLSELGQRLGQFLRRALRRVEATPIPMPCHRRMIASEPREKCR